MKKYIKKSYIYAVILIGIFTFGISGLKDNTSSTTSAQAVDNLSSKKIEWGIKRVSNHEQPDLGSVNKRIIDEANRNCNRK